MAKRRSEELREVEDALQFGTIVSVERLGGITPRHGSKDRSATAQQCFEQLKANPGDQPVADRLISILRQLPEASPWLRIGNLASIYELGYASKLSDQLDRYYQLDSLKTVLQFDNLYKDQSKKIYSHQRRLGADILERASSTLSKEANLKKIEKCGSFDELLRCVESAASHIHPFGTLAVYDTALRIGAKLGQWPEVVYLHAGAMVGYRALVEGRRVVGQKQIPMEGLPKEVQVLKPHHAENFLCIFKGLFKNSGSRRPGRPCC
jgi:hypothetical protein